MAAHGSEVTAWLHLTAAQGRHATLHTGPVAAGSLLTFLRARGALRDSLLAAGRADAQAGPLPRPAAPALALMIYSRHLPGFTSDLRRGDGGNARELSWQPLAILLRVARGGGVPLCRFLGWVGGWKAGSGIGRQRPGSGSDCSYGGHSTPAGRKVWGAVWGCWQVGGGWCCVHGLHLRREQGFS